MSHPAGQIRRHTCASVPNGIVTVGGYVYETGDLKNVYLFRNGQWSVVGQMQNVKFRLRLFINFHFKYQRYATMIAYDKFFIVFGGWSK